MITKYTEYIKESKYKPNDRYNRVLDNKIENAEDYTKELNDFLNDTPYNIRNVYYLSLESFSKVYSEIVNYLDTKYRHILIEFIYYRLGTIEDNDINKRLFNIIRKNIKNKSDDFNSMLILCINFIDNKTYKIREFIPELFNINNILKNLKGDDRILTIYELVFKFFNTVKDIYNVNIILDNISNDLIDIRLYKVLRYNIQSLVYDEIVLDKYFNLINPIILKGESYVNIPNFLDGLLRNANIETIKFFIIKFKDKIFAKFNITNDKLLTLIKHTGLDTNKINEILNIISNKQLSFLKFLNLHLHKIECDLNDLKRELNPSYNILDDTFKVFSENKKKLYQNTLNLIKIVDSKYIPIIVKLLEKYDLIKYGDVLNPILCILIHINTDEKVILDYINKYKNIINSRLIMITLLYILVDYARMNKIIPSLGIELKNFYKQYRKGDFHYENIIRLLAEPLLEDDITIYNKIKYILPEDIKSKFYYLDNANKFDLI